MRFFRLRFVKFLFVGLLNTAFGYVMYALFTRLGLPDFLAVLFSTIIGVMFNFKTTGALVFKNQSNRLILRFFGVYAVYYVIDIICLRLIHHWIPNAYLSQFILVFPLALVSYTLLRIFVFDRVKSA